MTYPRATRPPWPTFHHARRSVGFGCRGRILPLRRGMQNGLLRGEFSFYVEQTIPTPPPRPPRVTRPFPPPPPPRGGQQQQQSRVVTVSVKPPTSDAVDVQFVGEEFGRPWFLVSPAASGRDTCRLCRALFTPQQPTTADGGGTSGDATPPQPPSQEADPTPPVRLSARGRFSFATHPPPRRRQTTSSDSGSASNSTASSACHTPFPPGSAASSSVSCRSRTPVLEQHDDVAAANADRPESSSPFGDLKADDDAPHHREPPQSQSGGVDEDDDVEMTGSENVDDTRRQDANEGGENVNLISPSFQIQGQTEEVQQRPRADGEELGSVAEHSYHLPPESSLGYEPRDLRSLGLNPEVVSRVIQGGENEADETDPGSHGDAQNQSEAPQRLLPDGRDVGEQRRSCGEDFPFQNACQDKVSVCDSHNLNSDDSRGLGMEEEARSEEDCLDAEDLTSVISQIPNKLSPLQSESDDDNQDVSQRESGPDATGAKDGVDKSRHDAEEPRADSENLEFSNQGTPSPDRDDLVSYGALSHLQSDHPPPDGADGADSNNIRLPKAICKMRRKDDYVDDEVEVCSNGTKCPSGDDEDLDDGHSNKEAAAPRASEADTAILGKCDVDGREVGTCQHPGENLPYFGVKEVGDGNGQLSTAAYKDPLMIYKDSSVHNPDDGDEVEICGGDSKCQGQDVDSYRPPVVGIGKEDDELPTSVYRKRQFQSKDLSTESEDDVITIDNDGCDNYGLDDERYEDSHPPRAHKVSRVESEDDSSDDDVEILSADAAEDGPVNYCIPVVELKDGPSDGYRHRTRLPRAVNRNLWTYQDSTIETEEDEVDICSGESSHPGGDEDYRPPSARVKKQAADCQLPRAGKRSLRSHDKEASTQSDFGDVEGRTGCNRQSVSPVGTTEDVDDTARSRRAVLRNLRRHHAVASSETTKKARKK